MTNNERLFTTAHDLTYFATNLPSPYIDYVIAELERLIKYTDKKIEEIYKREKENKNVRIKN